MNNARKILTKSFCDGITLSQTHLEEVPVIASTIRTETELQTGKNLRESYTSKAVEGSHSTRIQVKSDGHRVTVSGNIGRLSRPDNVYGYPIEEVKAAANRLLAKFGCPPFAQVDPQWSQSEQKLIDESATCSRIDYTKNFATGSDQNAKHYLAAMARTNPTRLRQRVYENGVTFGEGSRYRYIKLYNKAADIEHWLKQKKIERTEYHEKLIEFCRDNGIVRWEIQLKKALADYDFNYWQNLTHENINQLYEGAISDMTKDTEKVDLLNMPLNAVGIYTLWQKGYNLKELLPRNTFYRHRKELLKFGVDIAKQLNVTELKTPVKTITLKEIEPPEWYHLPPEIDTK